MSVDVTAAIMDVEYDGSERSVKQLSAMTGLPGWAIRRSREPTETKQGRRQRWARWQDEVVKAHLGMLTDDEVEQLRGRVPNPRALDNLTNLTLPEVGALVGHTAVAVKIRIVRKGWTTWSKNPQWLTATSIGLAMNVDPHAVVKWIDRGYLKAGVMPFRGRLAHRVTRTDLIAFIRDPENWAYYDPHRIRDAELREEALAVRQGDEYITVGEVARRLRCGPNWVAELIRRGKIPAKRWGNYLIHRDDAKEIRLVGVGHWTPDDFRAYNAEERARIMKARSIGMPYMAIARELGRIASSVCDQWKRIRNDGIGDMAGDCGHRILLVNGQVLASWKQMARNGDPHAAGLLSEAVDSFLLGSPMTSAQMIAMQGLFEIWLDFFVDGRQLRRQRTQLKYKVIRHVERLRAIYIKLLSIGLDPCHDRWVPGWDGVITEGRRLRVKEARDGLMRPAVRDPDIWKGKE